LLPTVEHQRTLVPRQIEESTHVPSTTSTRHLPFLATQKQREREQILMLGKRKICPPRVSLSLSFSKQRLKIKGEREMRPWNVAADMRA